MKEPISFRTADVKQSNLLSILRFVRSQSVSTKPAIGEALGLSRPTVNNLVDELLQNGILRVTGMGSPGPSGGKPPSLISINDQAGLVLGVALGRQTTSLALTDLNSRPVCRYDFPTNHLEGPEHWYSQLQQAYRVIIGQAPYRAPVIGAGIAATALVESRTGKLIYAAHMPEWIDVDLADQISARIGIPVYAETEAYAYTVAEKLFGAAADVDNFVCIFGGEAVGAGIYLEGKLYRGVNGSAGEIGHTSFLEDDQLCYCGNKGCLETIVSSTAIKNRIMQQLKEGVQSSLREVVDRNEPLRLHHIALAANEGDSLAIQVIEAVGYRLGISVAATINMYNPGMIILCGEITELGEPLLQSMRQQVSRRSLPIAAKDSVIIHSGMKEQTSDIAGATLVIHRLFSGETDLSSLHFAGMT